MAVAAVGDRMGRTGVATPVLARDLVRTGLATTSRVKKDATTAPQGVTGRLAALNLIR